MGRGDTRLAESKRQLAMAMDLNKCLGCQTCTIACKRLWTRDEGMEYMWWNSVNTMPGRGTPVDYEQMGGGFDENGKAREGRLPTLEEYGDAWKFNYKEVFSSPANAVQFKPQGKRPTWGPNWDEDQGGGDYPNSYYFYLPRICNHCSNPACVAACPRNAIEKSEKNGIVTINEDRCRGYRFCAAACPYKKIYFNVKEQVSQKCIFCFPRIDQGVANACARQCPGRVRFVGYKDDTEGPIYKLVEKWKVALPLHPEYGTQANVFYVPPVGPLRVDGEGKPDKSQPRIPDEYLISLFGPKVLEALAIVEEQKQKVHAGGESELIDILISRKWTDMFGGFDKDPETIKWT